MANEVPFAPSQVSLKKFLAHIRTAGVPAKVDITYLKSVGFKSGNDSYIIGILKKIGFLSPSGVPEDAWKSYRDKSRASEVLGEAVKKGYEPLFNVYPDAYQKDDEAISNWVRGSTSYDDNKVGLAVATFKTLSGLATFDSEDELGSTPKTTAPLAPSTTVPIASVPAPTTALGAPSININIELHLPVDTDGDTYNKFFEAMKTHLFPDATGK